MPLSHGSIDDILILIVILILIYMQIISLAYKLVNSNGERGAALNQIDRVIPTQHQVAEVPPQEGAEGQRDPPVQGLQKDKSPIS